MFIKDLTKKNLDPAHKLKLIVDIGINEQKIKYNARALLEDNVCLLGCDGFTNDSFDEINSEEDLIDYLIATINAVYTEASKLFLSSRKTEEYLELSRVFVYLPDSIRLSESNNINIETLKEKLKSSDISIDLNLNFIVVNNTVGDAIGVAKQLISNNQYKNSFELEGLALGIIADDNFGAVKIKKKQNDYLEIQILENCNLAFKNPQNDVVRIYDLKNSVENLIVNYALNLGITHEKKIEALVNTGKIEMVTQKSVELDKNKHDDVIFSLLETGFYISGETFWHHTFIKIDEANPDALQKFKSSRLNAITQYIDALASFIYYQIKQGTSLFIVRGKLVREINLVLKKVAPRSLCAASFRNQLLNQVEQLIKDDPCNQYIAYDYEIICEEYNINIDKNTIGNSFLQDDNVQSDFKGDWIRIPVNTLKNKEKII